VPPVRRAWLPNRGGAREAVCDAGCHAAPKGKGSFCCEYSRDRCRLNRQRPLVRVQTARLRSGSERLQGSQASLNSNCQKTGESKFSSRTTRHVACNVVVNAFQQYEWLASLATAKLKRKRVRLEVAHPPLCENGADSLEIHEACLLKSRALRQEKASACNENCAATDEHFCHDVVFDCCADVNAAWTEYLNSLFDDYRLAALDDAVAD